MKIKIFKGLMIAQVDIDNFQRKVNEFIAGNVNCDMPVEMRTEYDEESGSIFIVLRYWKKEERK